MVFNRHVIQPHSEGLGGLLDNIGELTASWRPSNKPDRSEVRSICAVESSWMNILIVDD